MITLITVLKLKTTILFTSFYFQNNNFIVSIRENIPAKELIAHPKPINFEGTFFEINLKNRKWLVFGGYNPDKQTICTYVNQIGSILDFYMHKYDNFLLLGDLNSEMS